MSKQHVLIYIMTWHISFLLCANKKEIMRYSLRGAIENGGIVSVSCKVPWFSGLYYLNHATFHEAETTITFSTVERSNNKRTI